MAQGIFDTFRASKAKRDQAPEGESFKVEDELRGKNLQEDYMRQAPRRWNLGDVYAPHDLSSVEQRKWRGITNVERDLVDLLGLKPLDMYRVSFMRLPSLGYFFRPDLSEQRQQATLHLRKERTVKGELWFRVADSLRPEITLTHSNRISLSSRNTSQDTVV